MSKQISKLEKQGQIRKLAPRIYSPNLEEQPAHIIKRNILRIVAHLYPNTILSHRSALEFRPTDSGHLFLTTTYNRKVLLPGITLQFMRGPGPEVGTNSFMNNLFVSEQERALLENLQQSRKSGPDAKIIPLQDIEEKLEQIVRVKGENGLNALRDRTRQVAGSLGMGKEFEKLNKMISALLSTKPSNILTSPAARARSFGHPYDQDRLTLFENLFIELQKREFTNSPDRNTTPDAFRNFAFFEAYFSNYIEGTKFNLEDAQQIIDTGEPIPARNDDSHDILGTFQLVSNHKEMERIPKTSDELIDLLQYRHRIMMAARISKNPGVFKDRNNQAGDTHFVDLMLVKGTLIAGLDLYHALKHPFAKAAYMMFMISEIHPFLDGNGRIARIMMNAELVNKEQTRIIIPTVFREDYLGALRQLTRRREPDAYIRMLQRAQLFSATLNGKVPQVLLETLQQSNAFKEGDEHILKIVSF